MDIAVIVIRLTIAAVLFAHATQKLFGWFGGAGFQKSIAIFTALGQRPAAAMVVFAAATELGAALLLAVGLATPLGAAAAIGVLLVAAASTTRVSGSLWASAGGGEYPFVVALVAAAAAFGGGGAISVDALLGAPWHQADGGTRAVIGVVAVLVGVAAALVQLSRSGAVRAPSR